MTGDQADCVARLRAALPQGWFADDAPILAGLLNGLASVWASLYALVIFLRGQTRIATASAGWLDLIARDYGGARWARQSGETDTAFRTRILHNLRRLRGTRGALIGNMTELTGRTPLVFEPANAADTGGYGSAGLAWNTAGGWGSLNLPYQCFVTAYRPKGGGIANVGGWGEADTDFALGGWNSGALAWGNASLISGTVTDAQMLAAVVESLPAATIAWTALSN